MKRLKRVSCAVFVAFAVLHAGCNSLRTGGAPKPITDAAKSFEFVKSVPTFHKGRLSNIATFKPLPLGTMPGEITFQRDGAAASEGSQMAWQETMVVQETAAHVVAHRKQ